MIIKKKKTFQAINVNKSRSRGRGTSSMWKGEWRRGRARSSCWARALICFPALSLTFVSLLTSTHAVPRLFFFCPLSILLAFVVSSCNRVQICGPSPCSYPNKRATHGCRVALNPTMEDWFAALFFGLALLRTNWIGNLRAWDGIKMLSLLEKGETAHLASAHQLWKKPGEKTRGRWKKAYTLLQTQTQY